MRALTLSLITLMAICCSCNKVAPPGVAFNYTETLKPTERATVEQHRTRWTLIGDGPAYRATWTNGGSVLHVHLTCNGIFSMSGPWPFGVFSDDGRLLEAWNAAAGHLRMEFHYYDGGHAGTAAARTQMAQLLTAIVSE